jgi:hypothetical protein
MVVKTTLSIPVHVDVKTETRDAYAKSLKMILQHVADFHMTVVDIISEKYNIPVDEIMNTVTSDSRYTNMLVDPNIHHFTSSSSSSSSSSNQNHIVEPTKTKATTTTTPIQIAAPITKKTSEKKIKIKPKNNIEIPHPSS